METNKYVILDHQSIPLPSGINLSARIWKPETSEALPVILEIHPYPKDYSTAERDEINHGWFAAAGYVSIRVDTIGSGNSGGYITDEYKMEEQQSILDALDWISAQEWCDGNIGMFGHSWGAYCAIQTAANNHPNLKAVAVSGTSDDLYADDCHFKGGVMVCENIGWAATMLSFFTRPPTAAGSGARWREKWIDRLEKIDWILPRWLEHQLRDDYWKQASICDQEQPLQVPLLAASGWADTFSAAVVHMAVTMPESYRGVVGPWAHRFPHMGVPGPAIGWLQECVSWWDYWLKNVANDVMDSPRLRLFMPQDVTADSESSTDLEGQWIGQQTWPPEAATPITRYLGEDHLLDEPTDLELVISSPLTLGSACGELMPMGWGADLPGDQSQDDDQSLVFDTDILDTDTDILGQPKLIVNLRSDKPYAFLVARICDVSPDGSSHRVSCSVRNLNHFDNHETMTLLQPGEERRFEISMDTIGYRFCKGHKIRLALSNNYWPLLWPSPEQNCLTLLTAQSCLELPLRQDTGNQFIEFAEPLGAEPLPRTSIEPATSKRSIDNSLSGDRQSYRIIDESGKQKIDHNGLTTWGRTDRCYEICANDPTSAVMTSSREINLLDSGHHLKTLCDVRVSCDRENFHSEVNLEAWDNDGKVFNRSWKQSSPRSGN